MTFSIHIMWKLKCEVWTELTTIWVLPWKSHTSFHIAKQSIAFVTILCVMWPSEAKSISSVITTLDKKNSKTLWLLLKLRLLLESYRICYPLQSKSCEPRNSELLLYHNPCLPRQEKPRIAMSGGRHWMSWDQTNLTCLNQVWLHAHGRLWGNWFNHQTITLVSHMKGQTVKVIYLTSNQGFWGCIEHILVANSDLPLLTGLHIQDWPSWRMEWPDASALAVQSKHIFHVSQSSSYLG